MKPPENRISAWEFVGPAFLKALEDQPPGIISGTEVVAVLVVGINPTALSESLKSDKTRELARVFADFYATHPELTLRLLAVIRKKWNSRSITAKVQKLILTQPYFVLATIAYNTTPQGIKKGALPNTAIMPLVMGEKTKLKNVHSAVEAVKKARKRVPRPSERPVIIPALNEALWELNRRGIYVGLGWGGIARFPHQL